MVFCSMAGCVSALDTYGLSCRDEGRVGSLIVAAKAMDLGKARPGSVDRKPVIRLRVAVSELGSVVAG